MGEYLSAYLDRIGLGTGLGMGVGTGVGRGSVSLDAAGLAAVHRAHVVSIPFENLDPHRGVPVSLDPDALVAKLVTAPGWLLL